MNEQNNCKYKILSDGRIVVPNYCAAELPQITVELRSGKTTYRFTGCYDGTRSLPSTLLDHMADDLGKIETEVGEDFHDA